MISPAHGAQDFGRLVLVKHALFLLPHIELVFSNTEKDRYVLLCHNMPFTEPVSYTHLMETMELAAGQPVPVKINAVSIDFSSMDESGEPAAVSGSTGWKQMVDLTGRYPIDVRFIEMMPIGYGKQFKTMNHKDLLEEMYREYPGLEEDHRQHGYGPAVYYRIPGALGSVGLISAIHGKFCNDCNRIRLTSQGYLKTCLCYEDGTDLRAILREGMDMPEGEGHYRWPLKDCPDDEMLQKRLSYAMRQAIEHKPAAHCFERPGQITESHNFPGFDASRHIGKQNVPRP